MKMFCMKFKHCLMLLFIPVFASAYTAMEGTSTRFLEDLDCLNTQIMDIGSNNNIDKKRVRHRESNDRWNPSMESDPIKENADIIHRFLFGVSIDDVQLIIEKNDKELHLNESVSSLGDNNTSKSDNQKPELIQYPTGNAVRAELFNGKPAVHVFPSKYLYVGHCRLNITSDYMQTAVDAFVILTDGNMDDLHALPPEYVLNSARTIAMLKLPVEKLSALWTVVKNGRMPKDITFDVLEKYRPLFKYINAREITRLNLLDPRILTFVGTYPDLDRHKIGVIASKYIELNRDWRQPRYLNMMNNLICGIPVNFMRRLSSDVYLQLSTQVFYHISACSPLQKRFFLNMMTKTDVLGKAYSWSARDVSRLGLLLTELHASNFSVINPSAMQGITAQVWRDIGKRQIVLKVMLELHASKLQYLSKQQLDNLAIKPLNILARKVKEYQDQTRAGGIIYRSNAYRGTALNKLFWILLIFGSIIKERKNLC